jgi:hypothetical protein
MDARITKGHFETYSLVNIDTMKTEETGLLYVVAKDRQNILWARGIKTKLVAE